MHSLIVLLAFAANPIIDSEDAPRSLQSHAFDSVFRVCQDGTGTGVSVQCQPHSEKGKFTVFIVTAWHCVDGDEAIRVDSVRTKNAPAYSGSFAATVVASDAAADVAVLKAICDRPIPCLRIAAFNGHAESNSRCPAITIGCSNANFPTIWNVEVEGRGFLLSLSGDPWVIDRTSIPGRSGGPLICTDYASPNFGRVLGVCARNHKTKSYFTDTQRVRDCLSKAGVDLEPLTTASDVFFPRGFILAALRLCIVAILCSVIRFDGDVG